MSGRCRTEPLVYEPRSFSADDGGQTKEDLQRGGRSWDVLLVEGALINVPETGQGRVVRGRRQLECGRTPEYYLATLAFLGEEGLTPEAYAVQFLDAPRAPRRGPRSDDLVRPHRRPTFPSSRDVPNASWSPVIGRAHLYAGGPELAYPTDGARAAVRVI